MDDITGPSDKQVLARYRAQIRSLSPDNVVFWQAEVGYRETRRATIAIVGLTLANVVLVAIDVHGKVMVH
jgi:hypothetical protein